MPGTDSFTSKHRKRRRSGVTHCEVVITNGSNRACRLLEVREDRLLLGLDRRYNSWQLGQAITRSRGRASDKITLRPDVSRVTFTVIEWIWKFERDFGTVGRPLKLLSLGEPGGYGLLFGNRKHLLSLSFNKKPWKFVRNRYGWNLCG